MEKPGKSPRTIRIERNNAGWIPIDGSNPAAKISPKGEFGEVDKQYQMAEQAGLKNYKDALAVYHEDLQDYLHNPHTIFTRAPKLPKIEDYL